MSVVKDYGRCSIVCMILVLGWIGGHAVEMTQWGDISAN